MVGRITYMKSSRVFVMCCLLKMLQFQIVFNMVVGVWLPKKNQNVIDEQHPKAKEIR